MSMSVAVVSWAPKQVSKQARKAGLDTVAKNPEYVIAYGGDGSLLFSEQKYPGVPKLLVRHERVCKKSHDLTKFMKKMKAGKFKIVELPALDVYLNGKKILRAMNDVNVHYRPPTALRFSVSANGKNIRKSVIGDGVVISTAWGSTAYFHSITGKTFSKGIGIGFSNPTTRIPSVITNEKSSIVVDILRGPGTVSVDCNTHLYNLKIEDKIVVKLSKQKVRVVKISGMPEKIQLFGCIR